MYQKFGKWKPEAKKNVGLEHTHEDIRSGKKYVKNTKNRIKIPSIEYYSGWLRSTATH